MIKQTDIDKIFAMSEEDTQKLDIDELKKAFQVVKLQLQEINDNWLAILPKQMHKQFWENTFNTYNIKLSPTLDSLQDGETYGKILSTALQNSLPLLSKAVGDLDDIADGTNYGKVNITSISGGNILLAQAVGTLDNIANGTNYGKVALTSISAGKIVVAGLDSGVTARMFQSSTYKTNMEAWAKTGDITYIDGGKIYTGSIVANSIAANAIETEKIKAGAVTADKIAANAIESDKIKAGAVTADKISVTSLSAIKATLGSVNSGTITSSFIIGSNKIAPAFLQASLKAIEAAILKAFSEESTS